MFVHYNGRVVNSDLIGWIDYSNLATNGQVRIYYHPSDQGASLKDLELVEGPSAFDLVMRLCPEALEGERAKYHRGAWAIHNLFGHPLMQLCAWLHLTPLGLKIHDLTVPNPITK